MTPPAGGISAARAGELPRPCPGRLRNLWRLFLAQRGEEIRLEIEQAGAQPGGGELRIGLPGQLGMECALDRSAGLRARLRGGRTDLGECGLHGAPLEKVAAESKEHRFGLRDLALGLPFAFDSEEAGDERAQNARRVDQDAGTRERVEGCGLTPIELESPGELRVFPPEGGEKRPVEVRQALLAVEVAVTEAVEAEREVPLVDAGGGRIVDQRAGL